MTTAAITLLLLTALATPTWALATRKKRNHSPMSVVRRLDVIGAVVLLVLAGVTAVLAAAVTVAAAVPTAIETKRSVAAGRSPDARQKTTSPSTLEKTGSTARATPPLAIRATRVQPGRSRGASVITQTRVVFRSSTRSQSGGSVIEARMRAVATTVPSSCTSTEPSHAPTRQPPRTVARPRGA